MALLVGSADRSIGQVKDAAKGAPSSATAQKSAAEARQNELRARLKALQQSLERSEAERVEARDALAESEAAISQANRSIHDLQQQADDIQRRIATLERERQRVEADAARSRERLATIVRSRARLDRESQWRALLSGENPNQIGRDRVYYGYLARAEADSIAQLDHQRDRIAELVASQKDEARQLAATTDAQQKARSVLQTKQQERQAVLAKIADRLKTQRKEVEAAQRDAQRLDGLIAKLSQLLADEQRRERDRRAAAAAAAERERKAAQAARANGTAPPPEVARTEPARTAPEASIPVYEGNGEFEAGRGRMRWPVAGQLDGRFGAPMPGSSGRATYKGWFIRASQGTEVHAVAAGRVVFADWLRGFGNLLIVDHGDQYLTIYGGNESLYKQAGQLVRNGETIATVGSTGGTDQTGLYFEMRHRGEPFDPARWLR